MGQSMIFPCADCGARDSRDESHAHGCPTLAPLSDAEVMRIARNVERLWADSGERRAERDRDAAREAHAAEVRRARARETAAYREFMRARRAARSAAGRA